MEQNAVKKSEGIVEDFDSIRQYLDRLENERARNMSESTVVIEERKSKDRTGISQLWTSGKI